MMSKTGKHFKMGKFGTSPRSKAVRDSGPGPGSYKIPSRIVEAPKYLVKRDERYAYS